MKKSGIVVLLFFISFSVPGQSSQERKKMERERQAIKKELNKMHSVQMQLNGQQDETLGQLNRLQEKMELQSKYIRTINKEISMVSGEIYRSDREITLLKHQLVTLKTQYARSIVYAYKNRSTYDYLNFIFSAGGFNEVLKRISYLRSYRSFRRQQAAHIVEIQSDIEVKKGQLLGKKKEKNSALNDQAQQLSVLEEQKKEKDELLTKLQSREKDLLQQIAARKKRDAFLKKEIAAVIRREIKNTRNKNPTGPVNSPATSITEGKGFRNLNEKEKAVNSNFGSNRKNLPWPVDNGYVCVPFGQSRKGPVVVNNPGITICTPSSGVSVKAVFYGEVSSVFDLGDGVAVMIRHDQYFTIYSNLSSAGVHKGMAIKAGQEIGRGGKADDGSGGQVDFILMDELKNVNPGLWLR